MVIHMKYDNLISAQKRAKHFGSIQFDGPFSVLSKTGACTAARNYCMLLDSSIDGIRLIPNQLNVQSNSKENSMPVTPGDAVDVLVSVPSATERLEELLILDMWAQSINKYCDKHKISNDQLAQEAFACFASRLWIDVSKLVNK